MLIAVRTTCGRTIGFGHLRRCLTLAEELQQRGHGVTLWLTGDESGPLLAAEAGVSAEPIAAGLPAIVERLARTPPDLLVVDDYALSSADLGELHRATRLAVVDDLADRQLDADLVQNGNANATTLVYRTSAGCRLLLGPSHSLLRPIFRAQPRRVVVPSVGRVLVMLGGSDARGLTARVTQLCLGAIPEAVVDVIVGPLAPPSDVLARLDARVTVHRAPKDLRTFMAGADLAVSAGGQTNYELAALGLPAVSICVADNQRGNLAALAAVPTLLAIFEEDDAAISSALERLAHDPALRQRMSDCGMSLVDGNGATRVAEALEALVREKHA